MQDFEKTAGFALRATPRILPPPELSGKVMSAIERIRKLQTGIKTAIFSVLSIASLFGCWAVWQSEGPAIVHSQAGSLVSLLFSDSAFVINYWREYLTSIVDSLPVASVAVVAFFVWVAGTSLWLTGRNYLNFIHRVTKHA